MHLLVRDAALAGAPDGKPPAGAWRAFLIRTARLLQSAAQMFNTKVGGVRGVETRFESA